jgi:hypothetical protein
VKPHILLLSKTGKAAAERVLHGAEKGFWDDRIWRHSKQPHERPMGMDLRQIKELAIVILAQVTSVLSVVEESFSQMGLRLLENFSVKQNGCEVMTKQHNSGRKKKRESVRNNETSL